jgi:hypothetical protein
MVTTEGVLHLHMSFNIAWNPQTETEPNSRMTQLFLRYEEALYQFPPERIIILESVISEETVLIVDMLFRESFMQYHSAAAEQKNAIIALSFKATASVKCRIGHYINWRGRGIELRPNAAIIDRCPSFVTR